MTLEPRASNPKWIPIIKARREGRVTCARIAVMLERSRDKRKMNLEMLDGFFAALICSPDLVPPGEYLREIWGGHHIGECQDNAEMHESFGLIIRHWNSLVRTFNSSGPFLPFLLEDDAGVAHANDWAQGFPIHPHMLRHATGYKLANDGQDTRALQHYLGRKNIMHTVRYTQLSPERFENFWQD